MPPSEAGARAVGDALPSRRPAPGGIEAARIAEVRTRLDQVRDPELDEAVTAMGFIRSIDVEAGDVRVRFQLPTQWCALNFAYLMAVDMRAAVRSLPWVASAEVVLIDHFAARRINQAVAADLAFVDAFPLKASGELDGLRRQFIDKAFLARQHAVLEFLLKPDGDPSALALLTIDDLERLGQGAAGLGDRVSRYLPLRRTLAGTAAFVTASGEPIEPSGWPGHVREMKRVRVAMAANAEHCRILASAGTDRAAAASSRSSGAG